MDQDGFLYYVEGFRDDMEDYVEEMDSRQGLSLSSAEDVLSDDAGVSLIIRIDPKERASRAHFIFVKCAADFPVFQA